MRILLKLTVILSMLASCGAKPTEELPTQLTDPDENRDTQYDLTCANVAMNVGSTFKTYLSRCENDTEVCYFRDRSSGSPSMSCFSK